ncbi:MAG TPA: septum formation initiator family protein [Deltaproteobacteria bacterium]|nr:septum formation initiator family protein [Deltaproteobacteria bacterium]
MRTAHALIIALIMTIASLLVFTLPGERGIIRGYQLHRELEILMRQNDALERENAALAGEATLLRDNMAYIEHVIVKELNMVRPGDTIVVFKRKKN